MEDSKENIPWYNEESLKDLKATQEQVDKVFGNGTDFRSKEEVLREHEIQMALETGHRIRPGKVRKKPTNVTPKKKKRK